MDYYYGTALITLGGDVRIRVNPENIQGDEVMELEMLLAHQVGFNRKPIMRNRWTTLVSGRPDQRPEVIGSKVYLNINGEERVFRFNQSDK